MFDIFRKPTSTDMVIPSDSCHAFSHKMAAFHSMINRLVNIPLSRESFAKELNRIHHIASVNGYDGYLIERILQNSRMKKAVKQITDLKQTSNTKKWVKLPYVGKESYKVS